MQTPRQLTVLLVALVLVHPASADDKDGFRPLFNGKDLTGWVNVNCHPDTFFVKDGEIITTGKPTGFLRTDRQYENCIIDFEWMHVNKKEVGNSGLFVWGDPLPAVGSGYTRGIEVQVLVNLEYKNKKGQVTATSHGDLFSIWGATCKPDRPHPDGWARCLPSENRAKGGGEWNHYRVTCNDGVIKLEVNGKEVSGVSECKPRKGYLALESEGAECHFRNIKIKELPSTNPKPDEIAKIDEGFKNLYFGDLTGWKVTDDAKEHWKPQDWRLLYDGKWLRGIRSEKEYSDFELIADVKFAADAFGFYLRDSEAGRARVGLLIDPEKRLDISFSGGVGDELGVINKSDAKPGEWNRLFVRAKGTQCFVLLNGKPQFRGPLRIDAKLQKGSITLSGGDRPVELANLFIRELK